LDTEEQGILFPDGWIAVARLDPYRVDWRSPAGGWRRGSPLPFASTPVDDRLKCETIAAFRGFPSWLGGPGCDPSILQGWPDAFPPFLAGLFGPELLAAPDANLIVPRASQPGATERAYDVIDRYGARIAIIVMSFEQEIVGVGPDAVYTTMTDALDLQTLRRHAWPP
jgi:hypothetical protein